MAVTATNGVKTFDEVADSGEAGFTTLDQKLAAALLPTIKADCKVWAIKVAGLEEKKLMEGKLITGQQFVCVAHSRPLQAQRQREVAVLYRDLSGPQWCVDNKVHLFLQFWQMFTTELDVALPGNILREMLFESSLPQEKFLNDTSRQFSYSLHRGMNHAWTRLCGKHLR